MLKHPKNIFAYSRKTTCVAVSTANFSDFFDFFSFRKGKLFVGWQSVAGMPSCAAYGCTNREERNKREKNTTFHRYVFLYFYSQSEAKLRKGSFSLVKRHFNAFFLNFVNPWQPLAIFFLRFPHSDPQRMRRWVINMRRDKWNPTARSLLCSKHFTEECFDKTGKTVRLRKTALPTNFLFPKNLQSKVNVSIC